MDNLSFHITDITANSIRAKASDIEIDIQIKDTSICIRIADNGCGMDPEKLMELQNSMNRSEGGYGLRNVNIRIKLQYGSQYGVYIESERGFGTKIRIEFPGGEREKA